MIEGQINFSASVDYDADCTFDVTVRKGQLEVHTYFHGNTDTWKEFGQRLVEFPVTTADCVVFEDSIGEYSPYFSLMAYCYDAGGHSAVRVVFDNRTPDPDRYYTQFSILAEVAAINRLGQMLLNWDVTACPEVMWEAKTS